MSENLFPEAGMKYWDDFNRRAHETVQAMKDGVLPMMRRVSVHITNGCNFGCEYCNEVHYPESMSFAMFSKLLSEYSEMGGGIVHVTGGEPTVVKGFPDYIREAGKYENIGFHMNTNLYSRNLPDDIWPTVKRLKVSLDSADPEYFNAIVRRKNAFEKVTENLDRIHQMIEAGATETVVSLTYTVTKENYKQIPAFLEMYESRWPLFYAAFFSSYKGDNKRFVFNKDDIEALFADVVPEIDRITQTHGDTETKYLFHASHEDRTFLDGARFPEVEYIPCYLQFSELAINERGEIWNCSHLLRDQIPSTGVNLADGSFADVVKAAKDQAGCVPIHSKCLYGCNKKLITFNQVVREEILKA